MGWSSGLAGRLKSIMTGGKPDMAGANTGVAGPINAGGFVGPMVGAGLPQAAPANPFAKMKANFGKASMQPNLNKPVMSGPPPRRQGPRMRRFGTF